MRLNDIVFSYEVAENQTNLFTHYHKRFIVRMSINGCDDFVTDYQCNERNIPTISEVVECVMNDAIAYESCEDILDFAFQYGFKDADTARKAYIACRDAHMWFETEWSNEDYCDIYREVYEN